MKLKTTHRLSELVDEHANEEQVNDAPCAKDPALGRQIGRVRGAKERRQRGIRRSSSEEEEGDDVGHLECKVVFPVRHPVRLSKGNDGVVLRSKRYSKADETSSYKKALLGQVV